MPRFNMVDIQKRFSTDVRELNPELFGPVNIDNLKVLDEKLAPSHRERANKYGAKKTKVGEHTFDSKKEANRYLELKAQLEAGEIHLMVLQGEITLLEGFEYKGEKVRAIKYTADFTYIKDGKLVIEDVKSAATARTEAFRLRWRLLQWRYKDMPDVVLLLTGD